MPFPHKFIKLTFKERVDLRLALVEFHRQGKNRECQRIQTIQYSNMGLTFDAICASLKVSYRSVKGWISAYQKGGLKALITHRKKHKN